MANYDINGSFGHLPVKIQLQKCLMLVIECHRNTRLRHATFKQNSDHAAKQCMLQTGQVGVILNRSCMKSNGGRISSDTSSQVSANPVDLQTSSASMYCHMRAIWERTCVSPGIEHEVCTTVILNHFTCQMSEKVQWITQLTIHWAATQGPSACHLVPAQVQVVA